MARCNEYNQCPDAGTSIVCFNDADCSRRSNLKATQKPQVSPSSSSGLLCCPWNNLEDENDGHYKNFAAWGKWMNQKSEAILDDMDITHETDLYGIMVDLIKET